MKRFMQIIAALLVTINIYGQGRCDISKISEKDEVLLTTFWANLKDAVNNSDKVKLAGLIRFPFKCGICNADTSMQHDQPAAKITKAQFDAEQYKMFFVKPLTDMTNKYGFPKDFFIGRSDYNTVGKSCSYTFRYISAPETNQRPGKQHCFDVEKIKGEFKITSAWSIP